MLAIKGMFNFLFLQADKTFVQDAVLYGVSTIEGNFTTVSLPKNRRN